MTRDEILRIIDGAYAARQQDDKAGLAAYWAPDATFQLIGTSSMLRDVNFGPAGAEATVETLIDQFQFHEVERVEAVVEGNMAAVRWQVRAAVRGRESHRTEILDLIRITEDGKIASILQFTDTAMMMQMLR